MKKIYTTPVSVAFGTLFYMCLALSANAQHPVRTDGNAAAQPAATTTAPRAEVAPPQRPAVAPPQRDNSNNMAPQQQPRNNGNANTQQQPPRNNGNYNQQQTRGNGNAVNQQSPQRNNGNYNPQQRSGIAPQQRGSNIAPQQRGGNYAQPRQTNGQQRGNNYYQGRNNNSYRSYPGLPYGKNRITVRPQGLYYNYRDYYRSYYTPRLGFSIGVLPFGFYQFYYGPRQYFYSEGLFYQYDNSQYTVVEPPIGAAISSLPDKASSIVINGQQYYELNGVYYKPVTRDDGSITYEVAGKDGELTTDANVQQAPPQLGDIADTLPDGYRTIQLGGQKYYVTDDGYYFQDAVDNNGNKVYKIVGVPDDQGN